jgi:hypothetical protein
MVPAVKTGDVPLFSGKIRDVPLFSGKNAEKPKENQSYS